MRSHFLCLILLHFLMQEGQTQEAARDKNMGVYNSKKKKPLRLVVVKKIPSWSVRVSSSTTVVPSATSTAQSLHY